VSRSSSCRNACRAEPCRPRRVGAPAGVRPVVRTPLTLGALAPGGRRPAPLVARCKTSAGAAARGEASAGSHAVIGASLATSEGRSDSSGCRPSVGGGRRAGSAWSCRQKMRPAFDQRTGRGRCRPCASPHAEASRGADRRRGDVDCDGLACGWSPSLSRDPPLDWRRGLRCTHPRPTVPRRRNRRSVPSQALMVALSCVQHPSAKTRRRRE
jgi:hypothetical protein